MRITATESSQARRMSVKHLVRTECPRPRGRPPAGAAKLVALLVRLPREVRERYEGIARERGVSTSAVARGVLEGALLDGMAAPGSPTPGRRPAADPEA